MTTKKNFKTVVKQVLDHEISLALRRSEKDGLNLVLEDPKVLANLKTGKLDGWTRYYYANRSIIRAKEMNSTAQIHVLCKCGVEIKIDSNEMINVKYDLRCPSCGENHIVICTDGSAGIGVYRKGQRRFERPSNRS